MGRDMSAVIEKWNGTLIVTVRLTLKPGRDDALIMLIQTAPRRGLAATVREAMRSGVNDNFAKTSGEIVLDLSGLGLEI